MAAQIIDGKYVSELMENEVKRRIAHMLENNNPRPTLAAVLVGNNPASRIYLRNKSQACERVGINSKLIELPEEATQSEIEECIRNLNEDRYINGILVQLPLPPHLDEQKIIETINPLKDVDGLTSTNMGLLVKGIPRFVPCTPAGVMRALSHYQINPHGMRAVIIGRSNIVGKPMALLLIHNNATVTVCHSKTQNLASITSQADLLVVAVGRAGIITPDMIKPGAIVIDVGINRVPDNTTKTGYRVVGDVHTDAKDIASWVTPVPGGVGPLTVAQLLVNTIHAAELQNN